MDYNFADDLRAIREILGYTQFEIAEQIGVEQVTISRNELHKNNPSNQLMELVYNFAFDKKIQLNRLKEMLWIEKLPLNQNLWQYNNKKIAYVKPLLNKFTTQFFYNHFKEEMKEYKDELLKTQELYTTRYGKGKYEHNFYMKNCLDDLYTRGANKILKNILQLIEKG